MQHEHLAAKTLHFRGEVLKIGSIAVKIEQDLGLILPLGMTDKQAFELVIDLLNNNMVSLVSSEEISQAIDLQSAIRTAANS